MKAEINAELPDKLLPLMEGYSDAGIDPNFKRRRYYVAYGGRGSAKSWSFARALILQGILDRMRFLCFREIQRTIADSVHRLLSDQIAKMNAGWYYRIQDNSISGINNTEFLFTGLRNVDNAKIKSLEGIDIAWGEEAHTITYDSWETLIPTIRADGSEIWATFNPELDTDDTYRRFVIDPPDDSWVEKVTWEDNPWFPAVLEQERLALKKRDPAEYEHVWEGKPRSILPGAIYSREVTDLLESGRYRVLTYNPKLPVHTIWDLGWNDQTSIIFVQKGVSELLLIDYEEQSFLRYDEWAKKLMDKPYAYGDHWLPHDAQNNTQPANGVSAQQLLTPLLRRKPKIVPRPETVEEPIRAARMMFPRVYMDSVKCVRLLHCLKRFRRAIPDTTEEPGAPIKDAHRHAADAFGYLAMIADKISNVPDRTPLPRMPVDRPMDPAMGM